MYFPIVDRSRPLPPLAADDAWMDALQAQWEAEDASAEDLPLAASGPEAAEAAAAAEALASARQAVQAAFNRSANPKPSAAGWDPRPCRKQAAA